tara:strand:- start:15714 stop:15872 length:159 start_codon:yes stop_codon:yes gene_type:complete
MEEQMKDEAFSTSSPVKGSLAAVEVDDSTAQRQGLQFPGLYQYPIKSSPKAM